MPSLQYLYEREELQFFYTVSEHDPGKVLRHTPPPVRILGLRRPLRGEAADELAKHCAQHYWEKHDGCLYEWPLTFCIYDHSDKFLVERVIELELTPTFKAMGE